MTPEQRVANYRKAFPNFIDVPMPIYKGRIEATWVIGNDYSKGTGFYGAYPHKLDKRILVLFPDCPNVMHLFSGTINDKCTFDINPELNPTICDSVRNIKNHEATVKGMDLIMADPPYDKSDFVKYNCEPISPSNKGPRNYNE